MRNDENEKENSVPMNDPEDTKLKQEPHWEKDSDEPNKQDDHLALGLALGLGIGASIGVATDNLAIGLALGPLIGMLLMQIKK